MRRQDDFVYYVFKPIHVGVFEVIQEFLEKNANPIDNT